MLSIFISIQMIVILLILSQLNYTSIPLTFH